MNRVDGHLWLWYCARCMRAEFKVAREDAIRITETHVSVNKGHKPQILKAMIN